MTLKSPGSKMKDGKFYSRMKLLRNVQRMNSFFRASVPAPETAGRAFHEAADTAAS
jgi:hypothetical protein